MAKELRTREEVDKDMHKVNDQLASILEEQHHRRLALLKRNEDITRDTVDVEVDIRRLENIQEQLTRQLAGLNEQRVELEGNSRRLQREVDDLTREDDGLSEENEKLSTERTRLEEETGRLKKLRADYISAIAKFKGEKDGLLS
jgi:chromosome segregation ATPase